MINGLLCMSRDVYLTLLAYRITQLDCGYSPTQLLMNRILCSTLPVTRKQRILEVVDMFTLQEKEESIREYQKRNHDQRHETKALTPLELVVVVWIPDKESEERVLEETVPHSHTVQTADGSYR